MPLRDPRDRGKGRLNSLNYVEDCDGKIQQLQRQIKDLRVETRKVEVLLEKEEAFQMNVLNVLKEEKAKLALLKKQSDPITSLVMARLSGTMTLQTIEDTLYKTPSMKNLHIYLEKFAIILRQLAAQPKLFKRSMMYDDFEKMQWDIVTLRKLQRYLEPNGYFYVGSSVETKIASILDHLYDGASLHYRFRQRRTGTRRGNGRNRKFQSGKSRDRQERRRRRNSIA